MQRSEEMEGYVADNANRILFNALSRNQADYAVAAAARATESNRQTHQFNLAAREHADLLSIRMDHYLGR